MKNTPQKSLSVTTEFVLTINVPDGVNLQDITKYLKDEAFATVGGLPTNHPMFGVRPEVKSIRILQVTTKL